MSAGIRRLARIGAGLSVRAMGYILAVKRLQAVRA